MSDPAAFAALTIALLAGHLFAYAPQVDERKALRYATRGSEGVLARFGEATRYLYLLAVFATVIARVLHIRVQADALAVGAVVVWGLHSIGLQRRAGEVLAGYEEDTYPDHVRIGLTLVGVALLATV